MLYSMQQIHFEVNSHDSYIYVVKYVVFAEAIGHMLYTCRGCTGVAAVQLCVTCAVLLQTKDNIVKHVMYCYVDSGWVYMVRIWLDPDP